MDRARRTAWLDGSLGLARGGGGTDKRFSAGVTKQLRARAAEAWRQYGYYAALAALLCVVGIASAHYRSRTSAQDGIQAIAQRAPSPAPLEFVAATPQPKKTEFRPPVSGEAAQGFAPDRLVWSATLSQWQTHPGTDFLCEAGEAVCAIADGTVIDAYEDALLGGVVEIDHGDGFTALYASLGNNRAVKAGERVRVGDIIGAAGNSAACEASLGAHVHLELRKDGAPVDFQDYVGE